MVPDTEPRPLLLLLTHHPVFAKLSSTLQKGPSSVQPTAKARPIQKGGGWLVGTKGPLEAPDEKVALANSHVQGRQGRLA